MPYVFIMSTSCGLHSPTTLFKGISGIQLGVSFAMSVSPSPRQNYLLAALPEAVYERLLPHLELVPMPLGHVLYKSGGELPYLYFPTSSIVSLVYVMANGASAEIAVTGFEGLLGVSLFLGGHTTSNQAVVQSAGHAYRIIAKTIKHEFDQ